MGEEKPYEVDERGRKCVAIIKEVNGLKKLEAAMKRGTINAPVDPRIRAGVEKHSDRIGMKRKRSVEDVETSRGASVIAEKRARTSSVVAARTYSRSMTPKPGGG